MLLIFGFASVVVGTLFIVLRGNFKRMFAYSSIEQMGVIAIALGFGGVLGFYGALLQILTHAIGKAVLFLCSGDLVLRYRTRLIEEVRGVLSVAPLTGAVLLLSAIAVAGSPPFGLFLSEFTIVRAGLHRSSVALVAALLVALAIVFIALVAAARAWHWDPRRTGRRLGRRSGGARSRALAGAPLVAGTGSARGAGRVDPGRARHPDHAFDPRDLMTETETHHATSARSGSLIRGAPSRSCQCRPESWDGSATSLPASMARAWRICSATRPPKEMWCCGPSTRSTRSAAT